MTVDSLRVASQGHMDIENQYSHMSGDTYKSIPDSFNFHPDSTTDIYDLTPLRRDTTFSKLNSDENLYESLFNPISNVETRKKELLNPLEEDLLMRWNRNRRTGLQDWCFIKLNEEGTGGIRSKIEV